MTAALPSLALALLCLLQAGAQVPVQPDLDTEKFAGEWHVTAIASNCSIFLKMKDGMKSSMAIVSFTPEGDLAMKLVLPLMDKCQEFELLFQQSGKAGHYMVTSGVLRSTREEESACDRDRLQPLRCPARGPAQQGRAQHGAAAPHKGAGREPPAPAEVHGAHPHHGPDRGHAGHPAQVRSMHRGHQLKGHVSSRPSGRWALRPTPWCSFPSSRLWQTPCSIPGSPSTS
ncbi:uncharacterized protein [Molothrus aeneus]|uniref:uncharacterized protein isoform X3 n=1 Tax=Molothrus aeneus TaxID=84833 RepID=UPI0034573D91